MLHMLHHKAGHIANMPLSFVLSNSGASANWAALFLPAQDRSMATPNGAQVRYTFLVLSLRTDHRAGINLVKCGQ